MNMKVEYFDQNIEINSDFIRVIEIENKKYFYRFVRDLCQIFSLGYSDCIEFLSYDGSELNMNGKIRVFKDYFDFGFASKKFANEFIKYIYGLMDEQTKNKLILESQKMTKIVRHILDDSDLPVYLEEDIDLDYFFKHLKIAINCKEDLLDNLFMLIDLEKALNISNILVFINLKQYLTKPELIELYKYAIYNQQYIFLVDSQCYGISLDYEKKFIIDEDLNEIML